MDKGEAEALDLAREIEAEIKAYFIYIGYKTLSKNRGDRECLTYQKS